nr:hypothetical protein [Prevotella sp.]
EKDIKAEECRKILEEDLSGDNMGAEYKKFIYWYGIVTRNSEKEYMDEKSGMKFMEVASDAARCGEPNAQRFCGWNLLHDDPDKAQEFFELAISQGDTGLAMELGQMYMFGNTVEEDLTKAASYFLQGARQEDKGCMMYLAHIYGVLDDKEMRDNAKQLYYRVYTSSDEDSSEEKSACYYYGRMLYQEVEGGQSLDDYDATDLLCLFVYSYVIGKFRIAADAYVKIAEQMDNLNILLMTPHIYVFAGDNATANEVIDYCMEHVECKDNVLIQKGIVDALTCNDQQAVEELNREALFEADEGNTGKEVYAGLLYKQGRYDELLQLVEKAEERGMAKAELIFYKGRAYGALGLEEKAVECFTTASEMDINGDNALYPAYALLMLNKYDECREMIAKGLDKLDNSYEYPMCFAYNNAAYYYMLMGDVKDAVAYFKKSVETGYLTFDYMKEYKSELLACGEIKDYIDSLK